MVFQLSTSLGLMLLAMTMTSPLLLVAYAVMFGMNIGLGGVFDNSVWANLFGRAHLGEIRGMVATMLSIGVAVGPILFGWSYDTLGNYNIMFGFFSVLVIVQMALAFIAPQPRRS